MRDSRGSRLISRLREAPGALENAMSSPPPDEAAEALARDPIDPVAAMEIPWRRRRGEDDQPGADVVSSTSCELRTYGVWLAHIDAKRRGAPARLRVVPRARRLASQGYAGPRRLEPRRHKPPGAHARRRLEAGRSNFRAGRVRRIDVRVRRVGDERAARPSTATVPALVEPDRYLDVLSRSIASSCCASPRGDYLISEAAMKAPARAVVVSAAWRGGCVRGGASRCQPPRVPRRRSRRRGAGRTKRKIHGRRRAAGDARRARRLAPHRLRRAQGAAGVAGERRRLPGRLRPDQRRLRPSPSACSSSSRRPLPPAATVCPKKEDPPPAAFQNKSGAIARITSLAGLDTLA